MESAAEVLGDLPHYGTDELNLQFNPTTGPIQMALAPEDVFDSPGPADEEAVGQLYSLASESGSTDESWASLVSRLQAGNAAAMAELYQVFAKGIRFYLCRQVGPQELDDRVHDAFLVVVQSIQRGELRDPRRLMGFVRTVVRRMVAAQIDREVQFRRDTIDLDHGDRIADQRANPEKSIIMRQKINLIRDVLDKMSPKDQEILRRFYVDEQHPDQICSEMNLSITQFRLLKSRAKARFGEEGRKKLHPESTICEETVRTFG